MARTRCLDQARRDDGQPRRSARQDTRSTWWLTRDCRAFNPIPRQCRRGPQPTHVSVRSRPRCCSPGPVAQAPAAPATCSAEQGQALIDAGQYEKAIRAFTCVIDAQPTGRRGLSRPDRGRAAPRPLLGRRARLPSASRPSWSRCIRTPWPRSSRATRLGWRPRRRTSARSRARASPSGGSSSTRRRSSLLDQLLRSAGRPVRERCSAARAASSRGATRAGDRGPRTGDRARPPEPRRPLHRRRRVHVRTSRPGARVRGGVLALDWGLDTPRVHAILAVSYDAFGDQAAAASAIQRSIALVTTDLVTASPLASGASSTLDLVPGRSTRSRWRRTPARRSRSRLEQGLLGLDRGAARARRDAGRRQR